MIALFLSSAALLAGSFGEVQPTASALLAADGAFTLRLEAPIAWLSAEVVVDGERAQLVGPTEAMAIVELRGTVEEPDDLLSLSLTAVTPDAVGVLYEFEVAPQRVPSIVPDSDAGDTSPRRRPWPFGRGGGPRP